MRPPHLVLMLCLALFPAAGHAQTPGPQRIGLALRDRKSTRLNSSHSQISYAVFCLKKKEHTSELQSQSNLVCRLLLEKKSDDRATELVVSDVGVQPDGRARHRACCAQRRDLVVVIHRV